MLGGGELGLHLVARVSGPQPDAIVVRVGLFGAVVELERPPGRRTLRFAEPRHHLGRVPLTQPRARLVAERERLQPGQRTVGRPAVDPARGVGIGDRGGEDETMGQADRRVGVAPAEPVPGVAAPGGHRAGHHVLRFTGPGVDAEHLQPAAPAAGRQHQLDPAEPSPGHGLEVEVEQVPLVGDQAAQFAIQRMAVLVEQDAAGAVEAGRDEPQPAGVKAGPRPLGEHGYLQAAAGLRGPRRQWQHQVGCLAELVAPDLARVQPGAGRAARRELRSGVRDQLRLVPGHRLFRLVTTRPNGWPGAENLTAMLTASCTLRTPRRTRAHDHRHLANRSAVQRSHCRR